jgi:hypothetical protein
MAELAQFGPMSAAELTQRLGKNRSTINSSINLTRERFGSKMIRVKEWERSLGRKGSFIPIYALGPGPDAPPPAPLSPKERCARYRERHRTLLRQRQRVQRGGEANIWAGLMP